MGILRRQILSAYVVCVCFRVYTVVHAHAADCLEAPGMFGYVGRRSVTENGLTCQSWGTNAPHSRATAAVNPDNFPDATIADAANYCRNPIVSPRPWCYTIDPNKRAEYCDIPACHAGLFVIEWRS